MPAAEYLCPFRVFLSSPGDVGDERALARRLLKDELPYDPFLRERVTFNVVSWDDSAAPTPMPAALTPQEAVNRFGPKPSACDIVVVVLWSRLGTHLDVGRCRKPNREPYLSGTEWEFEDALAAEKPPEVFVYRRTEVPKVEMSDPEVRAVTKAAELIAAGAIGRVVQTVGLGPHRRNAHLRPDWFWDPARNGGILADIATHRIDQFLYLTGSTDAEIVASAVANYANPEHPEFQDFGELLLRSERANGYVRLDWYTPDGLPTWSDGRLTVLGTEGYLELCKYVDIAGRPGGDHLFLVTNRETRHIDCAGAPLPYYERLRDDVLDRTETAMSQAHCFKVCELALRAQAQAKRLA